MKHPRCAAFSLSQSRNSRRTLMLTMSCTVEPRIPQHLQIRPGRDVACVPTYDDTSAIRVLPYVVPLAVTHHAEPSPAQTRDELRDLFHQISICPVRVAAWRGIGSPIASR